MKINVLKQNKATIGWAVSVFALALLASYLIFGSRIPLGPKVWARVAKILPIPVATVEGQDLSFDEFNAAMKLGSHDPMGYIVKAGAVKAIARGKNITASESETDAEADRLLASWSMSKENFEKFLSEKNVSLADFRRTFVQRDVLRNKVAASLNYPNEEVKNVYDSLRRGELFERVAEKYSDDPLTASFGGDSGFVAEHQIDSSVWQKASVLKDGEWAGPINTANGYIFIYRIEKQELSDLNPERLHLRVILVRVVDFDKWFDEQLKKLKIRVYI